MPVIAAAIIGGAVVASGASSAMAADKANKRNVKLAQQAQGTEIELANTAHQREVADLRAAGLNPILSSGGKGAATPSLEAATVEPVDYASGVGPGAGAAVSAFQQAKLIRAQTDKTEAEAVSAQADSRMKTMEAERMQGRRVFDASADPISYDEYVAESRRAGVAPAMGRKEFERYTAEHELALGAPGLQNAETNLRKGNLALARKQLAKVAQEIDIGLGPAAHSKVMKRIWEGDEGDLFAISQMLGGVVGQATGGSAAASYSARGLARDLEDRLPKLKPRPPGHMSIPFGYSR